MCVCTYLHGLLKAQYWNKWELIGIANPFMKAPLNICGVKKWGKWGWFHTTMGMFSRTCWWNNQGLVEISGQFSAGWWSLLILVPNPQEVTIKTVRQRSRTLPYFTFRIPCNIETPFPYTQSYTLGQLRQPRTENWLHIHQSYRSIKNSKSLGHKK